MLDENKKEGWIKFYRSVQSKGWYQNSKYVHLWLHLLLKATHEDREFMFNGENTIINKGQFITGRKELSKETGLTETTIERVLDFFEKNEHQIGQQKTNKNRLITILNWELYQEVGQQNGQQTDNKRTTNGHIQECKNVKNVKKETIYMSDLFQKFWSAYPRKENKKKAIESWNKLKPNNELTEIIISAIEKQKKTNNWIKEDGQYIPHPSTYLNKERWKDKLTIDEPEQEGFLTEEEREYYKNKTSEI